MNLSVIVRIMKRVRVYMIRFLRKKEKNFLIERRKDGGYINEL